MKIELYGGNVFGGPFGLFPAIMGVRKAFNSEDKSDTTFLSNPQAIGANDYDLLKKLVKGGDEHAKCMRFVVCYLEITAARYWWQQFDTYTVGTVRLSQSTMHTILKRPLDETDFERPIGFAFLQHLNSLIERKDFDKLKNDLPEGFLQTRMVATNYQALRHMYLQRRTHKLKEWEMFCEFIKTLPYSELITIEKDKQ
jgi:hypothetical protein